jgi:endonuclease/exonuclease/phosphatase family metal-dependent hydrolase
MLSKNMKLIALLMLFRMFLNNLDAQELPIWTIQGEEKTSAYQGQIITTEGNVVTAKGAGFFFIQTPDSQSDNNPNTSDALLVDAPYFGSVGDIVNITGRVLETDGNTIISGAGITITTISSGAPLPNPVLLDENLPSSTPSSIHSLEKVENMRVQFSAFATSPSNNWSTVSLSISIQRPFREPGIIFPGQTGLPVWDGNPELFWFDPNGLNAPNNRFINAGDQIEADAIMIEADSDFWLALPRDYTINSSPDPEPLREKYTDEFTVGSLNVLLLFSSADDIDTRLEKLAIYIDDQMQLPDILALQEVGSLAVLEDLAYYIELRVPGTGYQAYFLSGNDDINLAYLVKPSIQNVSIAQLGANEPFSLGGSLHNRPPLLLQANLPTAPPTSVQVLNLHMRSLIGIEGNNSFFVRNKRHQQAISVAEMVQNLQAQGNLIVLGDFNAFEFSDGYVDVVNQIAGTSSLGAEYSPLSIVDPPLQKPIEFLPSIERYSYVFEGNAQALDHCLIGNAEDMNITEFQYSRGNADYSIAYEDNASLAQSSSDHDGLVLYFTTDNMVVSTQEATVEVSDIVISMPQPISFGDNIHITADKGRLLSAHIYSLDGQLIWTTALDAPQAHLSLPYSLFNAGAYVLQVTGTHDVANQKMLVIF